MATAYGTESAGPMNLVKNADFLMAMGVVGVLVFMVIPLPPILLDLLLSFNITISLVVILVSMYTVKPLDLSAFPSVLLLATIFRLSLNIASTRLILLHGNEGSTAAGKVIMAFGTFVVGGNFVVGSIVFLLLVVVNFVVITKGAGRIAEVAARFTLDAMPGKQMSVDADLNAGLITDEEAKARRQELNQEAEYYGAMDGASKFVRGDAIAGVVIILINIIGGLAIGVLQKDMSLSEAAQHYTLLTVGDGLVTQIPALLVSTAAGIMVSGAASSSNLGKEVTTQLLLHPRAIGIAAGALLGFAFVPGLPSIPFIILSIMAGSFAYIISQARQGEPEEKEPEKAIGPPASEGPEQLQPLDILGLELGYGLIPLVDTEQNGELLDRVRSIRRQIGREIGIIVPPVHIQDNLQLKPGEYSMLLKGNEIGGGELMVNYLLAMDPGTVEEKLEEGIPTKEPTYGLPALWIKEEAKEKAQARGYTVVDPSTVLTTHVSENIRRYAHELVGRQEVQELLDHIKETHPKVVEELVPNLLSLGGIVKVIQNLLKEQIPVRDLLTILETLADWAPMTKDIDILTEYVRQALARTITKIYQRDEGDIPALVLDQNVENAVSDAVQQTEHGTFLAMEPSRAQKIMKSISRKIEKFSKLNAQPLVLCSGRIRPYFKQLTERFVPDLAVLSYNEILSNVKINSLGTVENGDAD